MSARPPEGDWLGTPFLTFDRQGPFGVVRLDRPEARNAMTPAMYFGLKKAVRLVNAANAYRALIITGTDDVFAPGGDLGGRALSRHDALQKRAADVAGGGEGPSSPGIRHNAEIQCIQRSAAGASRGLRAGIRQFQQYRAGCA